MSAVLQPTAVAVRRVRRARTMRAAYAVAGLVAVVAALFVTTMTVGSAEMTAGEVLGSLLGTTRDPAVDFVVRELRLPVALAATAVGLALGSSGAVFQQVLRNQLAAPDLVGVSAGASAAAVTGIVLLDVSGEVISLLAIVGSVLAAIAMYALAWRDGVTGYRLILIGIGIAAFFQGVVGFLLARASLFDARAALHWLTGAVGQAGARELRVLLVALVLLLPLAVLLQRRLRLLELGDDVARGLGGRVELDRLVLLVVSVVLVALATSVAGPIAFVALVAGPVANRLLGPAAGALVPAALTGAALVLASDLVANHLLPIALPTGVVTGAVGAPYLLWLLATSQREGIR